MDKKIKEYILDYEKEYERQLEIIEEWEKRVRVLEENIISDKKLIIELLNRKEK